MMISMKKVMFIILLIVPGIAWSPFIIFGLVPIWTIDIRQGERMTYREEVMRTAGVSLQIDPPREQLLLGATGLAGECGEVVDLIKKFAFHGKEIDKTELIKELGDVRWYLEYLLLANDLTMEDIEAANVAKLRKRYPNGFNYEDAVNRKDERSS